MNKCNIFDDLPVQQFKDIRKRTISNILATDMSKHFEIMTKLKKFIGDENFKKDEFEKDFLSQIIIHLADLSSPTKTWDISRTWSDRVNKEFKEQNIQEEKLEHVAVTPFMKNLDNCKIMADNEFKFIKYMVLPYYELMD